MRKYGKNFKNITIQETCLLTKILIYNGKITEDFVSILAMA